MRYTMLIAFIFLNIVIHTHAMHIRENHSQNQILRGLILLNAVVHTDVVEDNQPKQRYLPNQQNQKSFVKVSPHVRPQKKYAADKKLLAPRNKPRNNKKSNK